MGAGAGTDLTFVNVVVMKDSFETGMRMLSDMARHPAFAPEEIERQRQQTLSSLQVSFEDPEFVADAVFDRLVYGFHPYGMPQSGTPETLAAITRDDLVAYHQRNFVPNNAILAIVGDVTAEEAFDGVRKVFGDWQRRDVPRADLRRPARSDAPRGRRQQARRGADRSARRPSRASAANSPTTWRSTWRCGFSAARAPIACTRCCAPSAGSPTAPRPTWTRCWRAAISRRRPTRDPRRPAKCCG